MEEDGFAVVVVAEGGVRCWWREKVYGAGKIFTLFMVT